MDTPSLNRREFMKRGIAVSAAFGIPTIVPSLVFGENAPSNRVNVGLVGCGNIGNYHKNWLKQYPDTRIVAVADAYKSRRVAMAEEMNKHYESADTTKVYDDFREVIAHPEVDAIFIGAHDNWHTPMAIAAARAGKDIYCQKPLTLDLEHAKLLRQAVAEKSRIFQFGTQYRSESLYPKMVELVRNGYIGEVQRIDVWSRNVLNDTNQYHVAPYGSSEEIPVPEDLDFNVWQGPSPMVPYTADRCTPWGGYHCPETSLGFVAGCAIHPLGVAQWGNRSDHTSPIRYEGTGKVPAEGIFRTLERWDILCDYENGVKLHMMDMGTATDVVKTYYPKLRNGDGVVFHGTEGWIGDFNFGTFYASNQKLWKEELKPDDERVYKSDGHVRNFIDCVKSRKETVCPVEMAIRCDTIAHMVNVAAQTGRVINWDPKAEQIVGDEEAAKMLTRSCREEWKIW